MQQDYYEAQDWVAKIEVEEVTNPPKEWLLKQILKLQREEIRISTAIADCEALMVGSNP